MTPEVAAAYIQALVGGQETFDIAKLTEAMQVIGEAANENPSSPLAGLYTIGLQIAAQQGLSPSFAGGKLIFVPTLSQGGDTPLPQASAETTTATTTPPASDSSVPAATNQSLVTLPPVPPIPPEAPEEVQGPPPIGVPRDYTTPEVEVPTFFPIPSRVRKVQKPPRYYSGDEFIPATLDPTQVRRLQNDLVRAGLLKPGSFQPGFWDQTSSDAYFVALAYANQSGDSVQTILSYLATLPKPAQPDEVTAKEVRQFVPSDPATLAQEVKSVFRQRLDREPTPAEIRQMAAQLAGNEELAFDQETGRLDDIAAATAEQVARDQAAMDRANDPNTIDNPELRRAYANMPQVSTATGATVLPDAPAAIDPVARFLEQFDRRYGPEMRRNEAVADYATQRQNVLQSMLTMQSMIGG